MTDERCGCGAGVHEMYGCIEAHERNRLVEAAPSTDEGLEMPWVSTRYSQTFTVRAGESAPPSSTDEGEARMPVRRCAVCEGEITASSGEWWIPEQILHVEGGEPHRAVYVRDWQAAAIRAPLEERIRELEADIQAMSDGPTHDEWWDMNLALQAEVERLREALRDTATHLNMTSLVVDTALLPSPPSSTEGTDDEPTFDRLSMHRSEDWGTKEVEG